MISLLSVRDLWANITGVTHAIRVEVTLSLVRRGEAVVDLVAHSITICVEVVELASGVRLVAGAVARVEQQVVGSATALIFTVPKDDATTGTSRCLKRMGILRGNTITMRYRRLNLECTRNKTDASITVRRGNNE